MTKRLIGILFTLVLTAGIYAQDPNSPRFQNISVDDGLLHSYVNSVFQDSQGFIWISTFMGADRYDGYNFVHFTHDSQDPFSLSGSLVYKIFEDRDSVLWFGTERGLNKFNQSTNQFISYQNIPGDTTSISHNNVRSIVQDKSGNLWVGTYGGGLNYFDPETGKFKRYVHKQGDTTSIISNLVNILFIDSHNNFWVGTQAGGVSLFNPEKGTFHNFKTSRENKKLAEIEVVNNFYEDREGKIWICTWFQGLYEVDPITNKVTNYRNIPGNKNSLSHNMVRAITQDQSGNYWIATFGGGLNELDADKQKFTVFKNIPGDLSSIPNDFLWYIFLDNSGTIWLTTLGKGISHFTVNSDKFKLYTIEKNDLKNSNNNVNSIYEKDKNQLWIGTSGGINVFDRRNKGFEKLYIKGEDENFDVRSFYSDKANRLWIGTQDGLIKYDETTKTSIHYRSDKNNDKSITEGPVSDIIKDSDGNLWMVVSRRNINILSLRQSKNNNPDAAEFTKLPGDGEEDGLKPGFYNDIFLDHNKRIWIATSYSLVSYDKNRDEFQNVLNGNCTVIYEDKEGILWIGTWGNGLIKYNPQTGTSKTYSLDQGFPNYNINGIKEDNNNNLWITSNGGLTRFNKTTETFHNYIDSKNLQSIEFNMNSGRLLNDGEIAFGSRNGFFLFRPDDIQINNAHPDVIISDFRVANKSVLPGEKINGKTLLKVPVFETKNIDLSNRDKIITFEFAVLSFNSPDRNRYLYKLEGYDTSWITANALNHTATYVNLKPGIYTFNVKGANANGIWSDNTAKVQITVLPSFMRRWKYLIIGLIVIFLIGFIYFVRWSKKQFSERKRIAEWMKNTLEDERIQLRALIDNMPDSIYIKDRESRFLIANKKVAEVMKAKSPSDLIGKQDFDYYSRELASEFYNDEQKVMESGNPIIGKAEPGLDENGNQRIISTTKVPLKNTNGETVGIIGIGRDITKIKEVENELRKNTEILQETNSLLEERQEEIEQQDARLRAQAETLMKMNEELEKLNQTKDKFFSIIAHDLKNPFGSIMNFVDLLDINYNKWTDEKKSNIIKILKKSSESLYNLLENLLQWSRTQQGGVSYDPVKLDMVELTDNGIEFINSQSSLKNITIERSYSSDHIWVEADKKMIETVIRNLLSNAIKFTNNGGEIYVDVRVESQKVRVSVRDTGIGMSEDTQDKLFKIESNISTSGTDDEMGTGLGLILCNEFIKKHKGTILVESKPGKGSTFTFNIPVAH